jgi:hypothetical protein
MMLRWHMRIRLKGVGPGGWKCTCCGPAPCHRKRWVRARKKLERRLAKVEVERELLHGL